MKKHRFRRASLLGVMGLVSTLMTLYKVTWAQAGDLNSLIHPRNSHIVHIASTDKTGGNTDFVPIAPGQTLTVMDWKGEGIIRRWWVTIAPFNNPELHRQLIMRCYWDGETNPSVEVPIGDFFGVPFGQYHDFVSDPVELTSGGYNTRWLMPFHKQARITVENRSKVRVDALYYNLDIEAGTIPKDALYFHAQFRRQKPTESGKPVTLLETTGRGQYVGTLLQMQSLRGRGLYFLEGDEQVYVDGATKPSIQGTGTEDYFSSGWYFNTGLFSAPYHGLLMKDEALSRVAAYRWHIPDPLAFQKSLRFDIEHGAVNDTRSDYTSVAFWYQTHPHAPFPPLPADLMPTPPVPIYKIAGIVEGESLVDTARATSGAISRQDMFSWNPPTGKDWSEYSQLWWQPGGVGEKLTLRVNVPAARRAELVGYFTQARDYGDFQVAVNGNPVPTIVRGYNPEVIPSGAISFGNVPLRAGDNEITLTIVGKDGRSTGYLVGVDGLVLK